MLQPDQPHRLRFDSFELDLRTGELRKDGRLIKLQDQPIKLLTLLASRAGDLVTRAEIEKALWGDDEFVEFEHGINTAMRKIRDALGDQAEQPRYIETLPRKGYRFLAPVEAIGTTVSHNPPSNAANHVVEERSGEGTQTSQPRTQNDSRSPAALSAAIAPEAEFSLPRARARVLFLVIQAGYLAMYCAALYKMEAVEEALGGVLLVSASMAEPLAIVTAMCGIAVRLYLISSVGLDHPAAGPKFLRLFPILFLLDTLWAASPLLLARKIGYGLALGSVAALAYLPFSQRTLMSSIYRSSKASDGATPQS
jgi:DNA-binding winged helix-turn-helix (wHTH) protein